ncbi:hypothetical protein BU14_0403s0010 [Porphyra umbilicalis]|uniref:Zinc-ribbon domain-containing protein n=1 Tax=Porphyra umbilicalis TaxID=2786 RepID=A0A1X6NW15_PORUM|nr:hypothetical protein BU14_0403s0010 [Porphyra umbilicalis]|eukprot:OSX72809.1 hypothetical protein BU14_0403s0010 [Porphyra umbilicalis]
MMAAAAGVELAASLEVGFIARSTTRGAARAGTWCSCRLAAAARAAAAAADASPRGHPAELPRAPPWGRAPPPPVVPTPAAGAAAFTNDPPPDAAPTLPCGAMLSAPPCATGPCPYLRYRCPRGHIITAARASPAAVVCPACTFEGTCGAPHRPKHSIASLKALAASRGGFLLSSAYVNARTPVVWACGAGHAWPATADNVRRGSWCPTCARAASREAGLAGARAAAAARGGRE